MGVAGMARTGYFDFRRMQARPIDAELAGILESIYDVERDALSWISGILERLKPSICSRGSPSSDQRATLNLIAEHFAAAHRLRERLVRDPIDAFSEPGCSARHAYIAEPRCALSPRERQVLTLAV